jgi:NTE family protein
MSVALVLSGGGARGAYQAGVLKGIGKIASNLGKRSPFPVIAGVSAGAVNAAFLASYADHFKGAVYLLANLWGSIHTDDIFRTDLPSMSRIGMKWATGLVSGGVSSNLRVHSLVDTSPLRKLLEKHVKLDRIKRNIAEKKLRAIALTATDYATSLAVTFMQGDESVLPWTASRRVGVREDISIDHVMASAAIPLFFPAIQIGERYYGDGCLRNMAPLSPAVHLGVDKLLVIGVRRDIPLDEPPREGSVGATAGRVISVLINSIMLDGTEIDLEYLAKINRLLGAAPVSSSGRPLRRIESISIKPTTDIAEIALAKADAMPKFVRFLIKGLGPEAETAELMSYLLFEPEYCKTLLDLGYKDAMARADEIREFIKD